MRQAKLARAVVAQATQAENVELKGDEMLDSEKFWFFVIATVIGVFWYYKREKEYERKKKNSTCPRCKTPFAYYRKTTGKEILSEGYVSEDVKDSDGNYRRQAFRAGKQKIFFTATCKECGFSQSGETIDTYKERV